MIQKATIRTIDDMGRVVIPVHFRRALHWGIQDSITVYLHDNGVCMEKTEKACAICGGTDGLRAFSDKQYLCGACLAKIREKMIV